MINEKLKELAEQCSREGAKNWRTVATNLTDLHKGPSFLDELLTQVVNGTRLEILKEEDRWSFVRQEDGYLGWAYGPYLSDAPSEGATHVTKRTVALYNNPLSREQEDFCSLTELMAGTNLRVIESRDDWVHVQPYGNMFPTGWINRRFLRDMSELPRVADDARRTIVNTAKGLTGVYYLWGGCTSFGTDCSGLSQLVHRLAGYHIPRDADMQFAAGGPVEAPYQPGDLLFFHSDANPNKITHVGISTGGWNMIHSSRSRNGVYEEDVQASENLRKSFAGARTFLK